MRSMKSPVANRFEVVGKNHIIRLTPEQAKVMKHLMKGELPCPDLTRVASRVCEIRQLGVRVETELRRNPNTGRRFGVYHLLDKIREVV